jgi:hypothetical protein
LRLKVPRALCGELLIADPDQSGPSPDSPLCARCAELGGIRGQFVAPHQVIGNPFQRRADAAKERVPASTPGPADLIEWLEPSTETPSCARTAKSLTEVSER